MSFQRAESKVQLACRVCLCQYNSQDHRPLLLPACGHTFCAFCVECLHGQGKRHCPKCRKDGAVQPVSSLPVNYSLLDVAQDNSCEGAAAAIGPDPSSPHRTTNTSGILSARLPIQHHKVRQSNMRVASRINGANCLTPARAPFQNTSRKAVSNLSSLRGMTVQTPATATLGAYNSNPTHTMLEGEEQDEMDFQMAIHLTFCKDESHDFNLHTSCSSWCW